jgi:hypothetical protein
VTAAPLDPEQALVWLTGEITALKDRTGQTSARIEGLAASVEALGEQLRAAGATADTGQRLDDVAADVDALSEQVRVLMELQEGGGDTGTVWDWEALTRDQASRAWTELVRWLDQQFLPRNPDVLEKAGQGLKRAWAPCWYRHPDVVDDLSALYGAWKAAYHGKNRSEARAIEWRNRWLPDTITRLRATLGTCAGRSAGHKPPETPAPDLSQDRAMYDFVQNDINSRPAE